MLPVRSRHFWICKKAPEYGANILKRNGERVWFTVVVAGADLRLRCKTARVYVLASPHFYSASACAFTTTLNHFATIVMFHNITPVTYGLPVSKIGPPPVDGYTFRLPADAKE